jgi:hypothetical protein
VIFATISAYWFVIPLVMAFSLVYSASRHEAWPRIWYHAGRLCCYIVGILAVTTIILLLINTQV